MTKLMHFLFYFRLYYIGRCKTYYKDRCRQLEWSHLYCRTRGERDIHSDMTLRLNRRPDRSRLDKLDIHKQEDRFSRNRLSRIDICA
jgi:hypothetical protein